MNTGPCESVIKWMACRSEGYCVLLWQRLIETSDRPLVHLPMWPIAAVDPHDRGLITVAIGVRRWPTECLRPVRGKALGVLRVESVAERMAHHFVLQHPRVPRAG